MREARAGDRYLLCSDGLSGVVSEETLAEALKDPDPQSTADRLIELALRSGGPDNVTVIVADVIEDAGRRRPPWTCRSSTAPPATTSASGRSTPARPPGAPRSPTRRHLPRRRPHRRRAVAPPPAAARCALLLVAVAVLVVLVAGAIGTYAWALQHWFVGVDGQRATTSRSAVFRGLNVSIVGFDLYRARRGDTGLAVADLTPAARSRVRGGITADDAADADRILDALRDQRLPRLPQRRDGEARRAVRRRDHHAAPRRPPAPPLPPGPTGTGPRAPATAPSPHPGLDVADHVDAGPDDVVVRAGRWTAGRPE